MLTEYERRRCVMACRALLLAAALSAMGPAALAAAFDGDAWFEAAPLPGPRAFHMTAFAVTDSGPRMYAIGGQRSPTDTMERLCIEYSPQANSWRQRAAMERRLGMGQACAVRGEVWVFGGCGTFGTGLADVEVYDPGADTWATGPSMPDSLYDFGAAVWRDSLVFLLGGGSWHPAMPPTNKVSLFDPELETWYSATPLPVPLGAMACGIVGDTLIVATGWTSSGPTNRAWKGLLNPANPRTVVWTELDTLPGRRRCRAVGGMINSNLYVIGGLSLDASASLGLHPSSVSLHPSGFAALSDVWSLSGSGEWTERAGKPHAVSCVYGTGSNTAGRVYVPGGYPGTAPYLQVTEYLDVSSYTHDVGITAIVSPVGRLAPERDCPASVSIRNFGVATEELTAHITILDSMTQSPVFSGDTTLSLASDSSRLVELGSFVPPGRTVLHTTAYVTLAGDENPSNDTARARSRTTSGSDPDGYGYVYKSTQEPDNLAFSWIDPSGGTLISNWNPNGDEGTSRRNLPFVLPFYGNSLSRVYVCTNGYLQTSNYVASLNFPLPYEGIADIIAPLWDDLSVRDSGGVYEKFTANQAIYTWVGARRAPPDTGSLTFQVVLQSNGDIWFNYLTVTADAASSTIGIQGGDGSWNWYQEYVYNADPFKHVPTGSTSILFDRPPLGVTEHRQADGLTDGLQVSSICRGPVRITVGADVRSLQIFSASGRLVRTLATPHSPLPTPHSLSWDRRDQHGRLLPTGAYFLRAVSPHGSLTRKLVLLD